MLDSANHTVGEILDAADVPALETLVFTEFKHNAGAAVKKLLKERRGDAVAALYHPSVGDIDLIWGRAGTNDKSGYGLAKIVRKHPEVLDRLQSILSDMTVEARGANRVRLESADHEAVISLDWFGASKTWLLTAYEKRGDGRDATMDTDPVRTKDDTASLDTATLAILPQMFDAVNMNPLQRARLSSRLLAMVADLIAAKTPIQRVRLAKGVTDLVAQLGGVKPSNEDEGMLTDIIEGRKDDRPLDVLWSLIYQSVEDLKQNGVMAVPDEILAHDAITHWAELEEKADV